MGLSLTHITKRLHKAEAFFGRHVSLELDEVILLPPPNERAPGRLSSGLFDVNRTNGVSVTSGGAGSGGVQTTS